MKTSVSRLCALALILVCGCRDKPAVQVAPADTAHVAAEPEPAPEPVPPPNPELKSHIEFTETSYSHVANEPFTVTAVVLGPDGAELPNETTRFTIVDGDVAFMFKPVPGKTCADYVLIDRHVYGLSKSHEPVSMCGIKKDGTTTLRVEAMTNLVAETSLEIH
jgi:hypothetical protein